MNAGGHTALRASVCNYRTDEESVRLLVDEIVRIGRALTRQAAA
nr:hypothetical protein [Streptomyces polyasparticus]